MPACRRHRARKPDRAMPKPPPIWLRIVAIPLFPLLLIHGGLYLLLTKLVRKARWLSIPFIILMLPLNLLLAIPGMFGLYVWALNSVNGLRDPSKELRAPCWGCGYRVSFRDAYADAICPWCGCAVSPNAGWTEVTS
jgi:hypothetical protein